MLWNYKLVIKSARSLVICMKVIHGLKQHKQGKCIQMQVGRKRKMLYKNVADIHIGVGGGGSSCFVFLSKF